MPVPSAVDTDIQMDVDEHPLIAVPTVEEKYGNGKPEQMNFTDEPRALELKTSVSKDENGAHETAETVAENSVTDKSSVKPRDSVAGNFVPTEENPTSSCLITEVKNSILGGFSAKQADSVTENSVANDEGLRDEAPAEISECRVENNGRSKPSTKITEFLAGISVTKVEECLQGTSVDEDNSSRKITESAAEISATEVRECQGTSVGEVLENSVMNKSATKLTEFAVVNCATEVTEWQGTSVEELPENTTIDKSSAVSTETMPETLVTKGFTDEPGIAESVVGNSITKKDVEGEQPAKISGAAATVGGNVVEDKETEQVAAAEVFPNMMGENWSDNGERTAEEETCVGAKVDNDKEDPSSMNDLSEGKSENMNEEGVKEGSHPSKSPGMLGDGLDIQNMVAGHVLTQNSSVEKCGKLEYDSPDSPGEITTTDSDKVLPTFVSNTEEQAPPDMDYDPPSPGEVVAVDQQSGALINGVSSIEESDEEIAVTIAPVMVQSKIGAGNLASTTTSSLSMSSETEVSSFPPSPPVLVSSVAPVCSELSSSDHEVEALFSPRHKKMLRSETRSVSPGEAELKTMLSEADDSDDCEIVTEVLTPLLEEVLEESDECETIELNLDGNYPDFLFSREFQPTVVIQRVDISKLPFPVGYASYYDTTSDSEVEDEAVGPTAWTDEEGGGSGEATPSLSTSDGGLTYECRYCAKILPSNHSRMIHERVHTGDRPYVCEKCGSCFKAITNLNSHLRSVHRIEPYYQVTGFKGYICGLCHSPYEKISDLYRHANQSHHKGTSEGGSASEGTYSTKPAHEVSDQLLNSDGNASVGVGLKSYRCNRCHLQFPSWAEMWRHQRVGKCRLTKYASCKDCGRQFIRPYLLRSHVCSGRPSSQAITFEDKSGLKNVSHVPPARGVACSVCQKVFPSIHKLKLHQNTHTGHKPYACEKCGMRFSLQANRLRHVRENVCLTKPYACSREGCHSRFSDPRSHRVHEMLCLSKKRHVCPKCPDSPAMDFREWQQHQEEHNVAGIGLPDFHIGEGRESVSEGSGVTCDICGKGFPTPYRLKHHRYSHTGEKPYSCPHCGVRFSLQANRFRHVRDRVCLLRPFVCSRPGCALRFIDEDRKLRHEEKCYSSARFTCQQCPGKTFTKNQLWKHRRRHRLLSVAGINSKFGTEKNVQPLLYTRQLSTSSSNTTESFNLTGKPGVEDSGEQQHVCQVCGQKCSSRSKLKHHMYTHSGVKPYECKHCGKRFNIEANCTRHVRDRVCIIRPYACERERCAARFTDEESLNRHFLRCQGRKPDRRHRCRKCPGLLMTKKQLRKHLEKHRAETTASSNNRAEVDEESEGEITGVEAMNFQTISAMSEQQETAIVEDSEGEEEDGGVTPVSFLVQEWGSAEEDGKEEEKKTCIVEETAVDVPAAQVPARGQRRNKPRCPICAKIFKTNFRLKKHMVIHTGEKAHACDKCGMRFNLAANCIRHIKEEVCTRRPFACDRDGCHSRFVDEDTKRVHESLCLTKPLYTCNLCRFPEMMNWLQWKEHKELHKDKIGELISNPTAAASVRTEDGDFQDDQPLPETAAEPGGAAVGLECQQCGKVLHSAYRMKKHMMIHSGEKPYSCSKCGMKFNLRVNCDRHVREAVCTRRPFACAREECHVRFTDEQTKQDHESTCLTKPQYSCSLCPCTLFSWVDWQKHQEWHAKGEPEGEDEAVNRFGVAEEQLPPPLKRARLAPSPMSIEQVTDDIGIKTNFSVSRWEPTEANFEGGRITCDVCNKECPSLYALKKHRFTHTGEKPFSCNKCGMRFNLRVNCRRHVRENVCERRPFSCSRTGCHARFVDEEAKLMHEPKCFRRLSRKILRSPQETTTVREAPPPPVQEVIPPDSPPLPPPPPLQPPVPRSVGDGLEAASTKQYPCSLCGESFSSLDKLESHRINHGGVKLYACSHCGSSFTRRSNYFAHVRRYHPGENPFKCSECGVEFHSHLEFLTHKETMHGFPQLESSKEITEFNREVAQFSSDEGGSAAESGEIVGQEVPVQCGTCNRVFPTRSSLQAHMGHHRRDKKADSLRCKICRKVFPTRASLHSHRGHHRRPAFGVDVEGAAEAKVYTCNSCEAWFRTWAELTAHHREKHAGSHPYPCAWCGMTFRWRSGRAKHRLICPNRQDAEGKGGLVDPPPPPLLPAPHLNPARAASVAPPVAPPPLNVPAFRAMMIQHQAPPTAASPPTHRCTFCSRVFETGFSLRSHMKIHSKPNPNMIVSTASSGNFRLDPRPYKCRHCSKTFRFKGHLTSHQELHHPNVSAQSQSLSSHQRNIVIPPPANAAHLKAKSALAKIK